MITAIFNKSNPINLVISSLILIFGFLLVQLMVFETFNWSTFSYNTLLLLLAISSMLLTDFIVKKNKLSDQNSFVIFFFSLFFFYFWSSTNNVNLLFANFFILLALRKIISLRSQNLIPKKIFDASLWLSVAVLFHFWSVLFFLVLYLGIALYAASYVKNWLIPLVGIFLVFIMMSAYSLVVYNHFFYFKDILISTDYAELNLGSNWFLIVFFTLVTLVSVVLLPSRTRMLLQKNKLSYFILFLTLIIAILLFVISPSKNQETLVFLYFPLAVIFTTFFEKIKKTSIQTIIIYLMLFVSILFCVVSA